MYIAIEGIDGCGKDTQAKHLFNLYTAAGADVKLINEPDPNSAHYKKIRDLLASDPHNPVLQVLFLANRIDLHIKLKPFLAKGGVVISSRSFVSSLVYGQDAHAASKIWNLHNESEDFIKPNVIVYLSLDPEVAYKRVISRGLELEATETLPMLTIFKQRYDQILRYPLWKHSILHFIVEETSEDKIQTAISTYFNLNQTRNK